MTRCFGIIGYTLGHSFSRKFFTDKFDREAIDGCYVNYEIEDVVQIKTIIEQNPALEGFNVTIPHKKTIMPLLDSISDEALQIGAVNCVKIENGKTRGFNTDVYGFRKSLLALIGDDRPAALILGTGGASLAARYVLTNLGIDYLMVSRTSVGDTVGYDQLDALVIGSHRLIVNTTPLGTFPNVETLPDLKYELLTPSHYLFDMVYNPPLTRFLEEGQAMGAKICNGAAMLVGQAEKSWEIWSEN